MNYLGLRTAIADWLMREDLAAAIPTFVRMVESELNRKLRVRQMLVRAVSTVQPFTTGSSFITLPPDWLEAKNVQFNVDHAGVRALHYITLQEADKLRSTGSTAKAHHYSIHGNQLEFVPPLSEDTEIELTYYARIPALEEDTDTNWLLDTWPDLYIYGALTKGAEFLVDDERAKTIWQPAYEKIFEEAYQQDKRAEVSGSVLRRRFTPIG
jgi:hypothetical protein